MVYHNVNKFWISFFFVLASIKSVCSIHLIHICVRVCVCIYIFLLVSNSFFIFVFFLDAISASDVVLFKWLFHVPKATWHAKRLRYLIYSENENISLCIMLISMRQESSSLEFSAFIYVYMNIWLCFLFIKFFMVAFTIRCALRFLFLTLWSHNSVPGPIQITSKYMNMAFECKLCIRNGTVGFAAIRHIYDYPSNFAPFQHAPKNMIRKKWDEREMQIK